MLLDRPDHEDYRCWKDINIPLIKYNSLCSEQIIIIKISCTKVDKKEISSKTHQAQ